MASADTGPVAVAVGGALLMSLLGFVGLDRKNFCGNGTLGAGAAIRGSVSIVAGPRPAMLLVISGSLIRIKNLVIFLHPLYPR